MNRRHFLTGIAAGMPLLTGCASLLKMDGEDAGTQGNTDTATPEEKQMKQMATAGQTAANQTPTPTSMQTPTPMATAASSVTGTASVPNQGGFGSTTLKTYTNRENAYSIKRPAGWDVTKKESMVIFISPRGSMSIHVLDISREASTQQLKPLINSYLTSFSKGFDEFKKSGKQKVQLPNNHTGVVVDLRAIQSSTTFHGKYLFVLANSTIYAVLLLTPQSTYGPSIEKEMMKILTSLTITSASTSTAI